MVRDPARRDLPNLAAVRDDVTLRRGRSARPGDAARGARAGRGRDELYHLAAPTFVPDSWADPTRDAAGDRRRRPRRCWPPRARPSGRARVWRGDLERGVRRRGRVAPARAHADAPALALRRGQARRARPGRRDARAPRPARCPGRSPTTTSPPRRPEHFLPRKVTRGAAAIALGARGRAGARRPRRGARLERTPRRRARRCACGAAADEPGDYVFASGVGRTVRDLVAAAFAARGRRPRRAASASTPPSCARRRPTPPVGDPSRARERARAGSRDRRSRSSIGEMVEADLAALARAPRAERAARA